MKISEHTETLKTISDYDGRIYRVDLEDHTRFFPSVTTVLGYSSDKTWVDDWRNRVGEEEVQRKMKFALSHGTDTHLLVELIASGRHRSHDALLTFSNPYTRLLYKKSLPKLIDSVNKVIKVEEPLASLKLGIAGRCDMVCEWNGIRSILDIKTASSHKEIGSYNDYLYQTELYADMLNEMNIPVYQSILFFILDEGPRPIQTVIGDNRTEMLKKVKHFFINKPEVLKMVKTKYKLDSKSILI